MSSSSGKHSIFKRLRNKRDKATSLRQRSNSAPREGLKSDAPLPKSSRDKRVEEMVIQISMLDHMNEAKDREILSLKTSLRNAEKVSRDANVAKENAEKAKENAEKAKEEAEKAKEEAEKAKEAKDREILSLKISLRNAEKVSRDANVAKENAENAKEEAEKSKEETKKAKEESNSDCNPASPLSYQNTYPLSVKKLDVSNMSPTASNSNEMKGKL